MSVYIDETRDWTPIAKARGLRHTHWCHLTADTEEKLHVFAARLELKHSCTDRAGTRWRRPFGSLPRWRVADRESWHFLRDAGDDGPVPGGGTSG